MWMRVDCDLGVLSGGGGHHDSDLLTFDLRLAREISDKIHGARLNSTPDREAGRVFAATLQLWIQRQTLPMLAMAEILGT